MKEDRARKDHCLKLGILATLWYSAYFCICLKFSIMKNIKKRLNREQSFKIIPYDEASKVLYKLREIKVFNGVEDKTGPKTGSAQQVSLP